MLAGGRRGGAILTSIRLGASVLGQLALGAAAFAQPVVSAWPVEGPDDTVAVAAAAVSGWYASADSFEDVVEVRDVRRAMRATITRAQLAALLPWMSLDGGVDGPCSLAFSDSGRVLFIGVFDDAAAPSGASDAVLRYDVSTGVLSVFARLELASSTAGFPRLGMVFHEGRLYVGSAAGGSGGAVSVFGAPSSSTTGSLLGTYPLPGGGAVHGLTVERDGGVLYAASAGTIFRAALPALPPSFAAVGSIAGIRSIAFADHYGPASNARRGLYVLRDAAVPGAAIDFVSAGQAAGASAFGPTAYASSAAAWHALAATADGSLLIGADEDAASIRDAADARLSFDAWLADEFAQVVAFSKGLIDPDGEPAGWVIDADVIPSWSRFHPATPDGAAFVVLALLASEAVNDDPQALPLVRTVLTRYAGLAPDGIGPSRTSDGIFRHWIDPVNGGVKPGWDPEYATLSTMLIVSAAARAWERYPDDPAVVLAASRIIFGVRNWGAYIQPGTFRMYFKGLGAGGADTSSVGFPFFEGITFVQQAAAYGGSFPQTAYAAWFNRGAWPTATYVPGRPITGASSGGFQSAFVSLYALLLQEDYRASPAWRTQIENIRWSSAAWTDDFSPKYFTVFSAGTTASQWGGYNADDLGSHPGDVTTFPSLEALCATGETAEAVAAYHAYRKGARQTFKGGASILYRRSDIDRAYTPNSAGLPDVVLGGLGLAELLRPGVIDEVAAGGYPKMEQAPVDLTGDGLVDIDDLHAWTRANTDLNGDEAVNAADGRALAAFIRRRESSRNVGGR